jgi:GNAT superfamily N-acetyltransferase
MEHRHDIFEVEDGRGAICRTILEALPDWFGIPEALDNYVEDAKTMTVLACRRDGEIAGMAALNRTSAAAVDIHVIGVLPAYHGQGIGTALIEAAGARAVAQGARLLCVKTLGAGHPDPFYGRTRRFYESAGFLPVEEFTTLWGPDLPCLLMVKPLG